MLNGQPVNDEVLRNSSLFNYSVLHYLYEHVFLLALFACIITWSSSKLTKSATERIPAIEIAPDPLEPSLYIF
jgi:hypothetical protein